MITNVRSTCENKHRRFCVQIQTNALPMQVNYDRLEMNAEEIKPASYGLGIITQTARLGVFHSPLSFPNGTSAPSFSSPPSSPQPWLPPWVTASGAHVTSALTPASPRPRQKRDRESLQGCGEGGKEGGVRPNRSASNPQAPRQAGTEGLHQMRNRSRSIYFSAVEIRPTTA